MTDEEIDIAIAEHMGWKDLHKIPQIASLHHGWSGINPETGHDEFIPQYCNDLNSMHEVENELYADQCSEYARILTKIHPYFCILPSDADDIHELHYQYWFLIHTTARQRAEAFLKTINKWEGS